MEIMFLATTLVLGIIACIIIFVRYSFWKKRRKGGERYNAERIRKKPFKTTPYPKRNAFDSSKNNLRKVDEKRSKVKPAQHIQKPNKLLEDEPVVTRKGDLVADLERQEKLVQAVHDKRVKKEEAYKRMHRQKVADSLRDMEGFLTLHKDNLPEKWKEMNAQLSIMKRKVQGIKGKQLESKNRNMLLRRIERYKGELVAVGNEIRYQKKQQSMGANEARIDLNSKEQLPENRSKKAAYVASHKGRHRQDIRAKEVKKKKPLLKQKAVIEVKKTDIEFDRRQKKLEEMVSQLQKQIHNK